MKKNIIRFIVLVVLIIAIAFLVKKREAQPKVITKTKVDYNKIVDSIKSTLISEKPKTVYIDTGSTKYIKGREVVRWRDSIVYVPVANDNTISANEYKTQLKSNNATADLKIVTTGELLDVTGTINYQEKETITTITKVKPQSGLFLYGETSTNPFFERAALGLDYQFKNTIIIGTSVSYNNVAKNVNFNVKLGIRIF